MSLEDCGPCLRDDTKNPSNIWCIECEEPLCASCQKAHKLNKTTQNHHLVENEKIERISDSKISAIQTCSVHRNLELDSYCKIHDALCCQSCLNEQHKSCEQVVSLGIAAKGIKTSSILKTTYDNVSNLVQVLNELHNDRTKNIETLQQSETEIKQTIEAMKSDIISRTNEMADTLLSELSHIKETNVAEFKEKLSKIKERTKAMEERKKQIAFISRYGPETHTLILAHKLKSELATEEKTVKKKIEDSRMISLRFNEINDIVGTLTTLGSIQVISQPCQLKYKAFGKYETGDKKHHAVSKSSIKSFKLISEYDLELEKGFVSGMCITDDDMLLLCVRGTEKLLIYSFDGKQNGEIIVDGSPFNVAAVSKTDKAVVALPNSSSLQFVNVVQKEAADVVEIPESCWSVTTIEDKLIVAGGFSKLYILDTEGKQLEEILKPENGRTYSLSFANDKLFYCADIDFKNEKVYCITDEGKFLFCYDNANLKTPTEITIDHLGNVYISDLDSNNVQRCSSSGQFLNVLVKGSDITEPRAICFNKTFTHFSLSNNSGKSICVFQSIFS